MRTKKQKLLLIFKITFCVICTILIGVAITLFVLSHVLKNPQINIGTCAVSMFVVILSFAFAIAYTKLN